MADSVFQDGFSSAVSDYVAEAQRVYKSDEIPWVVGYSGGKDSTAALQLVWTAISELPAEERHKSVHVISTDTLVENPVVSSWVSHSLKAINETATQEELPIEAHQLLPDLHDTFWVNLMGRGYPAPRPKFRWCTERLKIKPSNRFISEMVKQNGEAIVVLGTRKAESSRRAAVMEGLESERIREKLSPNASLPNSLVYSPIEAWTNDDVWTYLMQVKSKWGIDHKDLLNMYQGASEDGECPLVVDTSTPSCGSSRFGCWVCTLVDKDRSMTAMIQNDAEKEWMLPLLKLRDDLDVGDDRHLRDFRRMSGNVQMFGDRPIPGPYTQDARQTWLERVLEAQTWVRKNGPAHVREIQLIRIEELREIRRLWLTEKHEMEDLLPKIFERVTGEPFPDERYDDTTSFTEEDLALLAEICGEDRLHYELVRGMLDVERRYRLMTRRAGLFDALEKEIKKAFYENEDDAIDRATKRRDAMEAAKEGDYQLSLIGGDQ